MNGHLTLSLDRIEAIDHTFNLKYQTNLLDADKYFQHTIDVIIRDNEYLKKARFKIEGKMHLK